MCWGIQAACWMLWVTWGDVKLLAMCEDHMQIRCHFPQGARAWTSVDFVFSVGSRSLWNILWEECAWDSMDSYRALWISCTPGFLGQQGALIQHVWNRRQPTVFHQSGERWLAPSCFLTRDRISGPCNSGWHDNIQTKTEKRDIFLFPKVEMSGLPTCFFASVLYRTELIIFI